MRLSNARKDKNMKTKIYIVRHGQSAANAAAVIAGHTDPELTELGVTQAGVTADALAAVHFDAIYSSDLKRAYGTAVPHAELRGMKINTDKRFRELYMGDWENTPVAECKERWHDLYFGDWMNNFPAYRSPNGESVSELAERFRLGIIDIASRHPGETLLVATHAGAIRAFWGKVIGEKDGVIVDVPFPTNASYTVVECEGEKITPVEYSVDGHLEGMITAWKN